MTHAGKAMPMLPVEELEACARAGAPPAPAVDEVIRRARRRAHDLLEIDSAALPAAAAGFVSEIFNGLWLESPWEPVQARALLQSVAQASGVPAIVLGLEVLEHRGLLQLPPDLAVEAHADMLLAVSGARHVSLWLSDARGGVSCRARAGTRRTPAGGRRIVDLLLARADPKPVVEGAVVAAPVLRWQQPNAVVLALAPAAGVATCRLFVERSADILAPVLERQDMLANGARAEQAIVAATERRLARLGLDLHDGPLQAVIAAAQELERCRARLRAAPPDGHQRERVAGWLDDIEARLVTLESELRTYSSSLGSPGRLRRPLAEALEEVVRAARAGTEARVHMDISGDFDRLTQSQQIALVRIVQEALNNVRAHSGAAEARVSVVADRDHVSATVTDDGCGFDMERTLVRAAASGRLGMLGMDERVRLLGGTFRIRSREGGPTQVMATLPRWAPDGQSASNRKS